MFNSYTYSVEEIAKFHNWYGSFQLATTKNKVNSYICYFNNFLDFRFLELHINHSKYMIWIPNKFQEVCPTNPRIIDSKNFTGPNPPEWRQWASMTYFKDKLYYLGGKDPETKENTNRVDVRRSNESPWNNLFRF